MLDTLIIQKYHRVPATPQDVDDAPTLSSETVSRQMDAVLTEIGFKATGALLAHIAALRPKAAIERAVDVVGAARSLVGDHVAHNVYFIDFPNNVPDTMQFWLSSLRRAVVGPRVGVDHSAPTDAELMDTILSPGFNLLALPEYGRYRHSYAEMLARHDELLPSLRDRMTLLDLGDTVEQEAAQLYQSLAGSSTPLGDADRPVLELLASFCLDAEQPNSIPVRENRGIVNAVRLYAARPLVGVDTVTDVLRLACEVSDGDVTLAKPTPFRSFSRAERRVLLTALDAVVAANPAKLGDVATHAERWKRLDQGLHSGAEAHRWPHARQVFEVARGNRKARSIASKAELALSANDPVRAAQHLAAAPGMLVRSLDRLLRSASSDQLSHVLDVLAVRIGDVSGRVLLAAREHLINRTEPELKRVFPNGSRRAWVTDDTRPALDAAVIGHVGAVLDDELVRRLPACDTLVVDPQILGVALPLSGNGNEEGLDVMPRGTVVPVDGDVLRVFTYWRETAAATDFDLSALFLDDHLTLRGYVSYTSLGFAGAVLSGDITSAAEGASEFIDIPLPTCPTPHIVPQVNVYSGEGFHEVAESMIGYMTRDRTQKGAPFEAATVRTRSAMRGENRVALPFAFRRTATGSWECKWLHLYLKGKPQFNRVEGNHESTTLTALSILNRQYLTVGDLVQLWSRKATVVLGDKPLRLGWTGPVTYLGLQAPDQQLPEGSTIITLGTLNQLVPE